MLCGNLDIAATNLESAIRLDEKYPKPYYNLAVIEHVRENFDEGERLFALAAKLGFSGSASDKLVEAVQSAYASAQFALGPKSPPN
jgi:Flp pilus assembly protein TadD